MVRKIFKTGNSMVISLPKEMLEALHLSEGEEVSVELDPGRGQIIIAPAPAAAGGVDAEFARQVAEFIERYRPALEALARVIYLTAAQLLFIHARLLAETGGTPGILDLGLLASAVARPQATFAGQDLYPSMFAKAAALMDALVRNHPFVDGYKRAQIAAAGLFLQLNGCRLTASNRAVEEFALAVAQGLLTVDEVAAWFQQKCDPMHG